MNKYFSLLVIIGLNLLYANNTYYLHKVSQFKLLIKQEKQIIMLGDSITERGLWSELTMRTDIINRGISGDSTDGLSKRLNVLNNNAKQIFIMIGINDILRNKSAAFVFDTYKKILTKLQSKNIPIIIQSTLYIGGNAPKYYNKEVDKLNLLLEDYANKEGIKYIDLNVKFAPQGFLLEDYTLDGLHLNGNAYMLWVQIIQKFFLVK